MFPSFFHEIRSRPVFDYEIIVGSRSNSEPWLDRRRVLADSLGIRICSFDRFTPRFSTTLRFSDYSQVGDERYLDFDTRSMLACPFVSALADPSWRSMVRESRGARDHFMHAYGELLLRYRHENEYAKRFRRLLRRRQSGR